MARFWVRWMREGALFPWTRAAHEYLDLTDQDPLPRYSSLFCEMMPEERRKFFRKLRISDEDDVRFCLYAVTNKEQEEILINLHLADRVLFDYIEWPLTSLFLETAGKMYTCLDSFSFCLTLYKLIHHEDCTDFDFKYLAAEFFNKSPTWCKENVKRNLHWLKKFFNYDVLKLIEEWKIDDDN